MMAMLLPGLVGCGAGKAADNPSTAVTATVTAKLPSRGGAAATAGASPAAFRRALDQGARDGLRLGVRISAAIASSRWETPQTLDGERRLRWWSMAKPVTALALLQSAAERRSAVSAHVTNAMERAIRRSENCRQRRVVLALQRLEGGASAARERIQEGFSRIGVARGVEVTHQSQRAEQRCVRYLQAASPPGSDPAESALLLGTSTWTPSAAAAFAQALVASEFGAPGQRVLDFMRMKKLRSTEQLPSDYTAALDWGAGRVFRGWFPAYKSGWGGSSAGRFMAGQIVALTRPDASYGVAVMARPMTQPTVDDPGLTNAPAAVEAVLRRLRVAIEAPSRP